MRYFWLYYLTGAFTLYIFSAAFAYRIWGLYIFYTFTVLVVAAANVSLFRQKVGALLGLCAFTPVAIFAGYVLMFFLTDFGNIKDDAIFVGGMHILLSFVSVYYSFRAVFMKKDLQWDTPNEMPNTAKYVLGFIQLMMIAILFLIFYASSV